MKTKCEVYSRVVGYLRPVQTWNEGKQSEFEDRKLFDVGKNPSSSINGEKNLESQKKKKFNLDKKAKKIEVPA